MDKYTEVLVIFVIFLVIVGYLLSVGVGEIKSKDYIKSDTIITPQIKLVIVNNRVDTIYQYKTK